MADKVEEELVLGHAQHLLPNLKQPDKYIFAGTTNKKALFRLIMKMRRHWMHAKTKKNTAKYFVKPHNPSTGRTRLLRHIVQCTSPRNKKISMKTNLITHNAAQSKTIADMALNWLELTLTKRLKPSADLILILCPILVHRSRVRVDEFTSNAWRKITSRSLAFITLRLMKQTKILVIPRIQFILGPLEKVSTFFFCLEAFRLNYNKRNAHL